MSATTTLPLLLGEAPVGAAAVNEPPRLVDGKAEAASASAVTTAGYTELDETYAELHERVARAEVAAGAPLPIDPDNTVDQWMLSAVAQRAEEVAAALVEVKQATAALTARENELAEADRPPSVVKRLLRALALFGLLLVAAVVVGSFMIGGVDTYLFRGHFVQVFGDEAGKQLSLIASTVAAIVAAFMIVAAPALVVYMRHGAAPAWFKVVSVVAELGFAAAFTFMRMKDGEFEESLAAGVLEMAILLIAVAVPFALAGGLKEERLRTLAWRKARRRRDQASEARDDAEAALASAKAVLTAQIAAVEKRDLAGRKLAAWIELAEATRLLSYVTATAASQTAVARTSAAAHKDFVDGIRRHVEAEHKRAKARLED